MFNTPKDAPDTFIHAMSEAEGDALFDALNPSFKSTVALLDKIAPLTVAVRHRDLPIVRAQINPTIPVVKVAHALATEGLCLKHNAESGDLYLTYNEIIGPTSDDVTRAVQRSGTGKPGSIEEC